MKFVVYLMPNEQRFAQSLVAMKQAADSAVSSVGPAISGDNRIDGLPIMSFASAPEVGAVGLERAAAVSATMGSITVFLPQAMECYRVGRSTRMYIPARLTKDAEIKLVGLRLSVAKSTGLPVGAENTYFYVATVPGSVRNFEELATIGRPGVHCKSWHLCAVGDDGRLLVPRSKSRRSIWKVH